MKRKASQSQWLLNRHAFKQSGPCVLRGIANFEFNEAINSLKQAGLGKVRTVKVRLASNAVTVFIREQHDNVD